MAGLDVLIELAERPAAAEVRQLTDACSQSIERGICKVAGRETRSDSARALAIVGPGSAPDTVRVSVGVPGQKRDAWTVQTLHFAAVDDARERWRSVGFAIGAMAGLASDAQVPPAPIEATPAAPKTGTEAPPPASVAPLNEQKSAPEPAPDWRSRITVGPLGGQVFRAEGPAWGAWLGAGHQLSRSLELRVQIDGTRGQAKTSDLVGWGVDLGAGAAWLWHPWATGPELSLVGGALVHWLRVSARQTQPSASETGSRFLPGVRLALELSGSPADRMDLRLAVGARLLSDETAIRVGPNIVAESPVLTGFASVGVGYLF